MTRASCHCGTGQIEIDALPDTLTQCACVTRYESVEKLPSSRISINARMLSPDEITGIRIRTFDGADTWQFID